MIYCAKCGSKVHVTGPCKTCAKQAKKSQMNSTDQIEKTLEELICRHGVARVRADLSVLLPRAKWDDWQRLSNLLDNTERRLQRKEQTL